MWTILDTLKNIFNSFADESIIQHSIRGERRRRIEYLDSIIINQHVRWQSNGFVDCFLVNPEVGARIIPPLPRLSGSTARDFCLSILIDLKCRWDLSPDVRSWLTSRRWVGRGRLERSDIVDETYIRHCSGGDGWAIVHDQLESERTTTTTTSRMNDDWAQYKDLFASEQENCRRAGGWFLVCACAMTW